MTRRRVAKTELPDATLTGRDLVAEIERKLGLAVVVDSIEAVPVFTIHALLMFGAARQQVTVSGSSEADAWRQLARVAAEWRMSDAVSVTLNWGPGAL